MPTLVLDCFAGISGNMFLGALIDLGLPVERLEEELAKLPVSGYELRVSRVQKQGVSAVYLDVKTGHHHHHRHLADIFKIIDNTALAQPVKEMSKKVFSRLAEAEAKVHGTSVDRVHFHEVGAVDAIVDIVGTSFGLHYFGIEDIYTANLRTGTGYVDCAHGRMPVPAPATAELLRGIPYESGDIARELVTPTGAALVAALCRSNCGPPPGFVSRSIGYGAGTWDLDIPNVLRSIVGTIEGNGQNGKMVIETNIDDLNPQVYPLVMEKLLSAGAADVWLTPIIMKKGRPAALLSILADSQVLEAVFDVLFAETSTIGLRYYPVQREVAARKLVEVDTAWGRVKVKVSSRHGKVCNVAPEFEDCRQIAGDFGLPLKIVWSQATEAVARLYRIGDKFE